MKKLQLTIISPHSPRLSISLGITEERYDEICEEITRVATLYDSVSEVMEVLTEIYTNENELALAFVILGKIVQQVECCSKG